DFRAYADVGGRREALCPPGSKWGTDDAEIANVLFAARLTDLQEKRRVRGGAAPSVNTGKRNITMAELVRDHMLKKAHGDTTDSHMYDLQQRLAAALDYFGR